MKMGANRRVVRWLRFGFPLRFNPSVISLRGLPPMSRNPLPQLVTVYRDQVKAQVLNDMLKVLVQKNCITLMSPQEVGYFSRVFLVPKKTGKYRLVIDLSNLNEYLSEVTFKMDTLKVVKESLQQGMWATSLDLSDAYHHIPIHPDYQKYLCFQVGNLRFRFLVLPFGLMSAPWAFTEVVKQIKKWTSRFNLVLFQYLDDWLHVHLEISLCELITQALLRLCRALGLVVNEEKSELVPCQSITFLGENLDLRIGRAFTTPSRRQRIQSLVAAAIQQKGLRFARAESLLGLLVATYPTVPLGRLHLRSLQRKVIVAIRHGRQSNSWIAISHQVAQDLQWWMDDQTLTIGTPFRPPDPTLTVFTDASTAGWGVVFGDHSWHGRWQRSGQHINWLEMRTVLVALQLLQFRLRNHTVLFLIDNSTTVAYLRREGGTRSQALQRLTFRVLSLAHTMNIQVIPRHIAGHLNALADLASRHGQVVPSEWSLAEHTFQWVVMESPFGPPTLDMFANRINHRLRRYMSPCPDPEAVAIDALSSPWPNEVVYAFPPTCLLPPLLKRLKSLKSYKCLLVAPLSPNARWMPILNSLPRLKLERLPITTQMLLQPHWECYHPSPQHLQLHLWCLQEII